MSYVKADFSWSTLHGRTSTQHFRFLFPLCSFCFAHFSGRRNPANHPRRKNGINTNISLILALRPPLPLERAAAARSKQTASSVDVNPSWSQGCSPLPPAAVKWPVSLTAWAGPEALFWYGVINSAIFSYHISSTVSLKGRMRVGVAR